MGIRNNWNMPYCQERRGVMRDYTRKAKIKDSNEWVIGYHVYVDYLDKHYILVSEKTHDGFSGMLAMKQYEVDGDTICNPTGLNDKNGNKIWENDVVRCYADTDDLGNDLYFFYKVIWHESYHCWWLSDIHTLEDEYLHQYNSSDIKVIGNTFGNADLLKGE